eukprot:Gb_16952 [translate_table: standard]
MDMAASASLLSNGTQLNPPAVTAVSSTKSFNQSQNSTHCPIPHYLSLNAFSAQLQLRNQKKRGKIMAVSLHGRLGGGGGGAGVLERPGLDQSQYDATPSAEEGGEIGKVRQKRGSGGGDRYKVLLLDHERHTESQAVLPKVVPSVTPEEAKRCFHESRQTGAGLVTITVKEHAEFYAQMMARCGLRSSIEPDSDVL